MWVESEGNLLERAECSHKQAGGRQEDTCQRDLQHDEERGDPRPRGGALRDRGGTIRRRTLSAGAREARMPEMAARRAMTTKTMG